MKSVWNTKCAGANRPKCVKIMKAGHKMWKKLGCKFPKHAGKKPSKKQKCLTLIS